MLEIQDPLLVALAEVLKKQDVHLGVCENATFKHHVLELYSSYDDMKVLRYDGTQFLWEGYSVNINGFAGHRPVAGLPSYPLEFHEAAADVWVRLMARGRNVLGYQGLVYVNYSGVAIHVDEPLLMFMLLLVEGYALKNKLSVSFLVEDIAKVAWNDEAYDHLVYNEALQDVIVEKGLGHAAQWAARYVQDAVILLDEADVFMVERHLQDIARNDLVSIVLRELEYLRGIIFLTANLYSIIDSAFRSRVSLHLLFAALTLEARVLIWRKFLDRLPPSPQTAPSPPDERPAAVETKEGDPAAADSEANGGALSEWEIEELAAW
ncbi:hypothetical protein C8A01DRAFT_37152 [Parachaetomium inaequale]|uniref:DUF7025 domain-containing protein n=1 Tax=Parachaetomium inaequale TaxID=2588326 RepID=A0AAN6SQU8_9PEZI|nr:hypothetical protein C8A01DRAFT_37152 [Parachaetomium inaequale]